MQFKLGRGASFECIQLSGVAASPQRVCIARVHDWMAAIRVGNPPSSALANCHKSNDQTPPGIRKTNFREVLSILQVPNQIGLPGTQSADANLSFAFYAYQSTDVARPPGEKRREILLRVEGAASHGGAGEKLQKARVGYCVCCSHITHVAVPPTYHPKGP